jgi:hypothetical protein
VYCEAFGEVLLIDPVLPPVVDERERFWRALDRDIARCGGPPRILLTCGWHTRSSREIVARYAGATLWAPGQEPALPGGAEAIDAALADEVLLWLPSHASLVAGDTLLGDEKGGVRVCPDSWIGGDPGAVRAALWERVRGLPVERVLVSHGEPVLDGGRDALSRAFGR